jgi:hypothetical protein
MAVISELKITEVECDTINNWIYYRLHVDKSVIKHSPNIIMWRTNLNLLDLAVPEFYGFTTHKTLLLI